MFAVFVAVAAMTGCGKAPKLTLEESLQTIPGATVKQLKAKAPFKERFQIMLSQPLDHDKPDGPQFQQRILVSHLDPAAPVVLVTEGYAIRHNYIQELSELLAANQIRVEHRYFGKSTPKDMDWQYLNLKQATADYHRVRQLLGKLYNGKWISTGWSKGGQTALTYRSYYPDDVAVTVAYDAPLNLEREEPRIDAFFETVGDDFCRRKLIKFQRAVLRRKKELLPMFIEYAKKKRLNFSIGAEKAFEYVVLEYPFSFWQYEKIDCKTIPRNNAEAWRMMEHLKKVVSFGSYADSSMNSPAMYQFATEFGYYGYVTKNVDRSLSSKDYSNFVFAPQDGDVTYNPKVMRDLDQFLRANGSRILTIYGQYDPWSAPMVQLSGKPDTLNMVLKKGNHFTFIKSFEEADQKRMISTLKGWLDQ
jgi:pimeloyl-ACP methyl ester carboxylesterase